MDNRVGDGGPGAGRHSAGGSGEGRQDSPAGAFDPLRLLKVLAEHGVAYVVIGGVAAALHGSPTLTGDLDVCYERSRPNLERLAAALHALRGRLRGIDPDLVFEVDARTLGLGDSFTFSTLAGDFDCLGTPAGTAGFGDLAPQAVAFDLEGLVVRAASLDDLIRMKRAAGRPKDLVELEILGALRAQLGGEP